MKFSGLIFLSLMITIMSCKSYPTSNSADHSTITVDYTDMANWAAHPDKRDKADRIPGQGYQDDIPETGTDVFFVHPTTYTTNKGDLRWNADINDADLNDRTDNSTILYQASAFNTGGRVYAPRYQQAHIHAFFTDDRVKGERALETAYIDVKQAFEYYLTHYHDNRNIIIAAHSQGTRHAAQLLKDFFDQKPLKNKLVAAYIIGLPVNKDEFVSIPPCADAESVGCFISWRTFKKGHYPDFGSNDEVSVVNPLSWSTKDQSVSKDQNKGSILRDFDKVLPQLVGAQVHEGLLWVNKPKFPWSFLFTRKNYHVIDINLFYNNIRENVVTRIEKFSSLTAN